jgi:hypothetical protein
MSYAPTDDEFKARIAAFNRQDKRLKGHPAHVNGAAPIPLDDFRPERAKDEPLPWIDMSNWDNEPTPERE